MLGIFITNKTVEGFNSIAKFVVVCRRFHNLAQTKARTACLLIDWSVALLRIGPRFCDGHVKKANNIRLEEGIYYYGQVS